MIMIKNIITNVVIAQVIAGWEEGFTGQCAGEKITMIVPPSLGYGDQASDKVQDIATTILILANILFARSQLTPPSIS